MPKVNYVQPCGASDITITFPSTSGTLQLAGGGGITGFTSQISTAAPNATTNVSQLLVAVTTTNGDIALEPKGNGAILAQIPTSTTAGGDKRGTYAVDWQRTRSTNSARVASGAYAVIGGGNNNRASNNYDVVAGGLGNQASGSGCFIGGGDSHTASGSSSSIQGGQGNTASGQYSSVSGGQTNVAANAHSGVGCGLSNGAYNTYAYVGGGTNNYAYGIGAISAGGNTNYAMGDYNTISGGQQNTAQNGFWNTVGGGYNNKIGQLGSAASNTIAGGNSNRIDASWSFIGGGANNRCDGSYSAIIGGTNNIINTGMQFATAVGSGAAARDYGANCFANYYFATQGDAQATDIVLSGRTNTATPATLGMAGSNLGVNIPINTTATFHILVSARQTASSNIGAWEITGVIQNTANVLTTHNVTVNLIHRTVGTWDVTALANAGGGAYLDVRVTGTANTIQWVAVTRLSFCTIA